MGASLNMDNLKGLSEAALVKIIDAEETDQWVRSDALKVLHEKLETRGATKEAEQRRFDILLFDLRTMSYGKERFVPLMIGTQENGVSFKYPDPESFPEESFTYFEQQALTASNPIQKARYSDFLWESKKPKGDVKWAKIAINSYLDSWKISMKHNPGLEPVDNLERALVLALQINEDFLIDLVVTRHKEKIEDLRRSRDYRLILDLSKSLLINAKKLGSKVDFIELVPALEESIQYYIDNNQDNFSLRQQFLGVIRDIYSQKKQLEDLLQTRIRIAETFVEEGEWKKIRYPGGSSIASHFYEKAMQAYMDLGGYDEKVKAFKVKITELNKAAHSEYKLFEESTRIDRKPIDDYLKAYEDLSASEFIAHMVGAWPTILPSLDHEEEVAKANFKEFIAKQIFPQAIMKGALKIKDLITDDEKINHDVVVGFCTKLQTITAILLSQLFSLLEEKHPNFLQDIERFLSPSQTVDVERIKIIRHGLDSYKNKDYLSASHVFVFQIEAILRNMLGLMQLPTFSYRQREMRALDLNDILDTVSGLKGFPVDFLATLRFGLADVSGLNLRNEIAHGLLLEEFFTKEISQLLFYILLVLSSFQINADKEP